MMLPEKTDILIIGGGVAGLSLASFLKRKAVVLESADVVGGLSRSYALNGVPFDIGPHIIFSKNKEVLDLHTKLVPTNRLRRSNQILLNGRLIKYPFENDLASLPASDRDYCLAEYLNNPYENYPAHNMLQFFLRNFGEGITRLYLQPYNQKIWKFDPSCMDLQMVGRIPKPPRDDVIASAAGTSTEGYIHQLYFHYPETGGFQSMVDAYHRKAAENGQEIFVGCPATKIRRSSNGWIVDTKSGQIEAKKIINCAPIHEFLKCLNAPVSVQLALQSMLFNSIHIVVLQFRKDNIGDHFGFYIPDDDVIFHRLSKLNFLGQNYCLPGGGTTLMAEVTFRPGSYLGAVDSDTITDKVLDGLESLNLAKRTDLIDTAVRTEKYGYVIYDLNHRSNTDTVLTWLANDGIDCLGRFGEFEYLNTDGVVERSLALASRLNSFSDIT